MRDVYGSIIYRQYILLALTEKRLSVVAESARALAGFCWRKVVVSKPGHDL